MPIETLIFHDEPLARRKNRRPRLGHPDVEGGGETGNRRRCGRGHGGPGGRTTQECVP